MTNEVCIALFIVANTMILALLLALIIKVNSEVKRVRKITDYILEYNKITKEDLKDYIDNTGGDFSRELSHVQEGIAYIREDINSIKNETVKEDDNISTSIEAKKSLMINDKTLIKVNPKCTIDDLDGKKFKTENGLILSFGLVEIFNKSGIFSDRKYSLKISVEGEVKYKNE